MGEGEKVTWTIDVKQGVETAGAESPCLEIKREDGENSYFLLTVQREGFRENNGTALQS